MLKNDEVIARLEKKGIMIRSIQKLNKIMCCLGLIKKVNGLWTQTSKGMEFSPYKTNVLPANEWNEDVVDYISENYEE